MYEIKNFKELREVNDEVLIEAKNLHAPPGAQHVLQEIYRRDDEKFNKRIEEINKTMLEYTKTMKRLTWIIFLMTLIVTICTVFQYLNS